MAPTRCPCAHCRVARVITEMARTSREVGQVRRRLAFYPVVPYTAPKQPVVNRLPVLHSRIAPTRAPWPVQLRAFARAS